MTASLVNKIGTFCVVLQKALAVTNCPLPMGACTWKHRETGQCCYTPDLRNVGEIAALVGAPLPTELEVVQIRADLLRAIKENLK